MKMKKICFLLLLLIVSLGGCSDKDEELSYTIPPLDNLQLISGENKITLSWDNPDYPGLSYVEIKYAPVTASEEKTIKHYINDERSSNISFDIEGQEVYKFILTAFSTTGEQSAPQYIEGKPFTFDKQGAMDAILNSIEVESVSNGAKISWNNANNIDCLIKIEYTLNNEMQIVLYDALQTVPNNTINLRNSTVFIVSIVGANELEGINSSFSREFTVNPNKPYAVPKNRWTVFAVSTQVAESGNGAAECAIDENLFTQWQATQKGGNDWIIIDMGAPVVIESFALARCWGDSTNSAWDVTFSAGNETDPDLWEHSFTYSNNESGIFKQEFNSGEDGDQIYMIPEPITARYFKYRTDRISDSYATHYGEISVYGYYAEDEVIDEPEETISLNISSYNLRYLTTSDTGDKAWDNRKIYAEKIIRKYDFDIFGTQELVHSQITDLLALNNNYKYVGVGRDKGTTSGEYCAIFYKKDRFEILDEGTFWLSLTPEIPSKGWDAALNRITTWAKIKEKDSGKIFYFFNTHFDHQGVIARKESAKLLLTKMMIIAGDFPVICTGDFNLEPDSEPIKYLSNSNYVWDSRFCSETPIFGTEGTLHGYNLNQSTFKRIDYIFISKTVKVASYGVINDDIELNAFSSDHFPVFIKAKL